VQHSISLPLPWVAAELGWVIAEYGRQPWAIEGILPTRLGKCCGCIDGTYKPRRIRDFLHHSAGGRCDVDGQMARKGPEP